MMRSSSEWRYTAYRLIPRNASGFLEFWGGSFAPGATVHPYPDPRVFTNDQAYGSGKLTSTEVLVSSEPFDALVDHLLAQPCVVSSEPRLDAFAVGRLITGRARPRLAETQPNQRVVDVDATLSCAFQLAHVVVPTRGATLRDALQVDRLVIRLGMKGRLGATGDLKSSFGASIEDNVDLNPVDERGAVLHHHSHQPYRKPYDYFYYYFYPLRPPYYCKLPDGDWNEGIIDAGLDLATVGGQRFDCLRSYEIPESLNTDALCVDQVPDTSRTISIGWGWELPDDPTSSAFAQIVENRARTFSAVDCRRPSGWHQDFDLSCLLDEVAPVSTRPASFWLGLWVTSDVDHAIDYSTGGPVWSLPKRNDQEDITQYWIAEGSAVMGYWRILTCP